MPIHSPRDDARLSIASMPASAQHRKMARAFIVGIACVFAATVAIGLVPLPRSDGFIPAVQSLVAAFDLITAVLLFAQYASERSRALLILACGYLFTAVIVVAQTLTFPGAFSPTGLLGAGQQTAAWLYVVWHAATPAAACAYALLKPLPLATAGERAAPGEEIWRAVLFVVAAAAAVSWAVIAASNSLPTLVVTATTFAATASVVSTLPLLISVLAVGLVWRRRTSVIDEWLIVALLASVAELAAVVFLGASRYTFPFYATRILAVVASCAVLVALLAEMTGLYVRLAIAVNALKRERANKLLNIDVVLSSIAHEIKQPLMVITTCNAVISNLLRKPKIEAADVQINVDDMASASARIAETIDGLRGLFRDSPEGSQHVDVNALALEALETLSADLSAHGIGVTTQLAAGLPHVVGHRGQLRQVLVNIAQNGIDELARLTDRARTLQIRTTYTAKPSRVVVAIEDSGGGIAPERVPTLFTAFVTTKVRGMGLGLSICQMIVERHNGQLSVSSQVGKGTCFEISLPAEPAPLPVSQERSVSVDQSRSLKSTP